MLGDWSDDGHGKTSLRAINSNLSLKQIENAYTKGSTIVGFDLVNEVCCEYEDASFPKSSYDSLVNRGFKYEFDDTPDEDDKYHLSYDDFTHIYLFVVKLGNPKFEHSILNDSSIKIGGYGLFM